MAEKNRILEERLRSSIGYYDWNDVAQCACRIIRKLGVTGGRDFIDKIRTVLGLIANVREGIGTVAGLVNQLQSLGESLFGLDFVRQKIMSYITNNVNVCPVIDQALRRELSAIGYGVDLSLFSWFTEKVNYISAYGNKAQSELRDLEEFLNSLIEILLLVEDCAVEIAGDKKYGRSLKNVLEGEFRETGQVIEKLIVEFDALYKASFCVVNNEIWISYERDEKIYIRKFINNNFTDEIYVTNGYYPRVFFDGVYVYLIFSRNSKGQLIRILPQELGYLGLGFTLWDCIGMSGFVNSVGNGKFRGCVGEFGNVDRIVWNYKGEIVLVSYPDSFVGGIPVPTGLYWSDNYNRLNWSDVVVQSPWSRKFKIYEEGNLFAETEQTNYYDESFSRGMDYWITTVLRNTITGEEWEGCPSEKVSFDVPKIGAKEYIGMSGNVSDVGFVSFVSYDYNINSVFDTYSGINGSVAEESRLISYFANVTLGGEDVYDGVNGTVEEDVKFINFFPNELM